MSLLFSLLPSGLLQAVSRVLLHSLWQGLLLAVVAAVVVLCTRQSKPALRYNLLLLTWALFIGGVIYTAISEITASANPVNKAGPAFTVTPAYFDSIGDAGQKILGGVDQYAGYIFSAWFVFFLCKMIYLLAGLGYVRHIRQTSITAPPAAWQLRMQELAAQLQIRRRVVLWQSALAKVPLVTGIIKPVILLPAGLITQLPPEQVEAILLHELAHVRRQDYLVNLIQQLTEAIFFFNPGLLWVSRLIKDERENCCDELALQQLPDRRQLIHALVAFQEYQLSSYPSAPGFPGRPPHLLARVQRMLSRRNSLLSKWEFRTLAVCLVLLCITLTSLVLPDGPKENRLPILAANATTPVTQAAAPELRQSEQAFVHTPDICLPAQTSTIITTTTTTTTIIDDEPGDSIAADGNPVMTVEKREKSVNTGYVPGSAPSTGIKTGIIYYHHYDGSYNRNAYLEDRATEAERERKQHEAERAKEERIYERHKQLQGELPVSKQLNIHGNPRVNAITQALVDEKVLPDPYPAVTSGNMPNISYLLSNEELIVNGIKQPDAIHSRLKSRFLKPGMTVKVNWQS